ncbi:MAG: RnfABCDGE type electron transport complex subunit B [Muricomes sp.]
MISGILIAAAIVGGTGLLIGVFLGVSDKKFAIEVDEREAAVLDALPGNNCGACGYPGCSGLAAAIAGGTADVGACPVGGAPVAEKIGEIMGVAAGEQLRETAFVKCAGTCEKAKNEYQYFGIEDCITANLMQDGGPKGCSYGCLGFGTCVKVCPFDAIHIMDGIALVDKEKCKACKKCVAVCPKNLIEMIPYEQKHFVQCNSHDNGKTVRATCEAGCIGCRICERNCEVKAVVVTDNLSYIDVNKCTNCGICAEKCPRKIITPGQIAVS